MIPFPMPFSGIERSVRFPDPHSLLRAITYLALHCGHRHNIAVAFDGHTLYASPLAMECLAGYQEALQGDCTPADTP